MVPLLISPAEWARARDGAHSAHAAAQSDPRRSLRPADAARRAGCCRRRSSSRTRLSCGPATAFASRTAIHLHLHAVDLARSPDGQWWVLADRTQAPSGAGYALENRIVLSRILPEAFRDCQVQRLASFFRAQRDTLMALAPQPHDQPKVVLLTPGPYNETYFEHAYLARYLGFTLVEGGDLTVRDRRVFLKTLDGLQPVDVIFRRLDDGFCDPLELRSDSSLGVAGLVEAARAGNVAVANALGSGVIETAAIMPFLPALCRHLLGEDLLLPSVPTWWCGQPSDLHYVLEHLDQLVMKPAFPTEAREPVFGRKLSDPRDSRRSRQSCARGPDHFVAQEQVALSTAPVWHQHRMEPRPVVFRTYVAAAGDSYVGDARRTDARLGHARRADRVDAARRRQQGHLGAVGGTRELGDAAAAGRVADAAGARGKRPAEPRGRQPVLAGTLRRARRACDSASAQRRRAPDRSGYRPTRASCRHCFTCWSSWRCSPSASRSTCRRASSKRTCSSFIFKENPHAGLRQTLNELRRIAAVVRDRLSIDTWRILNQLHQDLRLRHGRVQFDDVLAHLNRMITDLAAFSGMEMENMTRGHGWRFLDVGRRLERAMNATSLLRQALSAGPSDNAVLEPLLEIADSSMTYRRRYFARPQLSPVLDLLLLDDTNTRAVAFQLAAVSEHIRHLPRDPKAPSPTREERLIDQAVATLRQVDPHTVHRGRGSGRARGDGAARLDRG